MSKLISRKFSGGALFLALMPCSIPVLAVQEPAPPAASSLAARLSAAKAVMISDAKGRMVTDDGGNNEAAASFYAAMRSWGRYRLWSRPPEARLILRISMDHMQLRLAVIDPETQAVLTRISRHVETGYLVDTRERNLNRAVSAIIDDLRHLAGPDPEAVATVPVAPALAPPVRPAQPRTVPAPRIRRAGPRVFVSNGGTGNCEPGERPGASNGVPVRPFNQFYAALQISGQYDLVNAPADADMVFEFQCAELPETLTHKVDKPGSTTQPPEQEDAEYTVIHPRITLLILDSRTLAVLGALAETVKPGVRTEQRRKNFSAAIEDMVISAGRRLNRPPSTVYVPDLVHYAPVPAQILNAKTVFVSNAMGQTISGGTPVANPSWNDFYATVKAWGRFELVPSPAGADLIFAMTSGSSEIRVAIVDPHTGVTLWAFSQEVDPAILASSARRNFEQALVGLVEEVAVVTGRSGPSVFIPQGNKDTAAPPQIRAAKRVFIANAGADNLPDGKGNIHSVYDLFYATVKKWGRYELTSAASDADLVLQVSYRNSYLQVYVLDPVSQVTLWGFSGRVRNDLNEVLISLVKNTAWLAGQPAAEISIPAEIPAAPVPARIGAARKVFVARSTEYTSRIGVKTDETQDQVYSELYSGMKSRGRYELTETPGEADLIFESFIVDELRRDRVWLRIRDARTRQVLWALNQPAKVAFLNSNAKKNLNEAVGLLIEDVSRLR